MNIAITGTSSSIGKKLLKQLIPRERNSNIIAIDIIEPQIRYNNVIYYKTDLRHPLLFDIFNAHNVKSVIHLSSLREISIEKPYNSEFDISVTTNLLAACSLVKVQQLVITSSSVVYGALPDKPVYISEQIPIEEQTDSYSRNKWKIERKISDFSHRNPQIEIVVLRTAPILQTTLDRFLTFLLKNKRIFTILGYNPLIQFLHEEDLRQAILLALERHARGIFNVSSKGVLPISKVINFAGNSSISLPYQIAYPLVEMLWKLHLYPVPPQNLNYFMYSNLLKTEKIENELSFQANYTIDDILKAFYASLKDTSNQTNSSTATETELIPIHWKIRRPFFDNLTAKITDIVGNIQTKNHINDFTKPPLQQ